MCEAFRVSILRITIKSELLNSYSILVKCYHDLSKRMGACLKHEERRIGFISDQIQTMATAHDDSCVNNPEESFQTILEKCVLAQNIKKMYEDLCSTGIVSIRINKWIPLTFCLPQKAHQWHLRGKILEPEDIQLCLKSLRPYHSLLLLYSNQQIKEFVSLDGSPSLVRLLSQYSPLKNLQTLAEDADLTLQHVYDLTSHLVYWAKATVIFPVCSTNKYVITPDAPITINSPLIDKFSETFAGMNLIRVISDFSLPTSLGQINNPLHPPSQESQLVQMVIWMLQHHLLLQLHTYIYYMPTDHGLTKTKECDTKDCGATASSRSSSGIMGSFVPCTSQHSRGDSESGASTTSETPDVRSLMDMIERRFSEHMSFTSFVEQKQTYQEELLLDFSDEERTAIFKIPATNNPEDLGLFARLCRKGYFQGNHHIEEIMYLENLRRSQLLQLLDKFRDVLITYETADPTIAMFSASL